jgi:RHS repeat-associated protein
MVEGGGSYAGAYYYHFDGLGSVVALSDADGETVQTYEYSVFGEPAASDPNHPNPYLFTARRFDRETGLYHYRARAYNATIGRFLQTDPAGQGMNAYTYCWNNPAGWVDYTGEVPVRLPLGPVVNITSESITATFFALRVSIPLENPLEIHGEWGIGHFFWKYFFGSGQDLYKRGWTEPLNLADTGLLDNIANAMEPDIKAFRDEMIETAQRRAYDLRLFGCNLGPQPLMAERVDRRLKYDFTPYGVLSVFWGLWCNNPLIILGGGYLDATAYICIGYVLDEDGEWTGETYWRVTFTYRVNDPFVDVLDIGNKIPGDQEVPGSRPYEMVGTWWDMKDGTCAGEAGGSW